MKELEGAGSNDPDDPGGFTIWGVTRIAWQDYLQDENAEWPPPEDKRTPEDMLPVYEFFWGRMECMLLPTYMQLAVFAFGFNAGYGTATKYMQKALGLTVDGIMGPITRSHYENMILTGPVFYRFCERVKDHYLAGHPKYKSGWLNRLLKSIIFA